MKMNFIKAFIIASMLALVCTACADSNNTEAPENSTNATQATQVSNSATATEATTQPPNEEVTEATTEADESEEEKQIVLDIYAHFWRPLDLDDELSEHDYAIMNKVDKLSDRYLGAITSEEDAIEKGEKALKEINQSAENYYSFEANFNEEYSVWVVRGTFPPSYVDENGMTHATLGTKPYIVIRESDGKALGTFSR